MKKFLFLLLFSTNVLAAGEDWTLGDTAWQSAYTTLLVLDCAQTRYGASHPEQFQEGNILLGKHPSKGRINTTCLSVAIGHYAISRWLPNDWRRFWQMGTSWIEAGVVMRNQDEGSGLEFWFKWRFK